MPDEACPQKTELLSLYQRVALDHLNSLTALQGRAGRLCKAEYDVVYERLEFMKAAAEKAKSYLESHAREHGC